MQFRDQLIAAIKDDPDVFNEVRKEIIVSYFDRTAGQELEEYIHSPEESDFLEEQSDEEIIAAVTANLKYLVEYVIENEERGV
ncbi:MAG: hypothetical protein ACQEQI_03895 [Bacillota bacterium]